MAKKLTTMRTIFVAYAVIVALASLQPGGNAVIGPYDKLAHFLTYGLFALLAYRLETPVGRYWFLCIGIVMYGGLLELAQSFVPGREMSALDLLANTGGVLLGALLCQTIFSTGERRARDA